MIFSFVFVKLKGQGAIKNWAQFYKIQLRALDYIRAGCCFNVLGSLTTFQLES